MIRLVKISTQGGSVFINPANVAAITPAQSASGQTMVGACLLLFNGGGALGLPATPEAAAKAMQPPAAGPRLAELNGEAP